MVYIKYYIKTKTKENKQFEKLKNMYPHINLKQLN